jgi:hypothetical protein
MAQYHAKKIRPIAHQSMGACLSLCLRFLFDHPLLAYQLAYTFARKESEPRKKVETLTGCVAFEILPHCDKHDGSPGGGRVEKSRGADRRGWWFFVSFGPTLSASIVSSAAASCTLGVVQQTTTKNCYCFVLTVRFVFWQKLCAWRAPC